jgi:hypothetical protein
MFKFLTLKEIGRRNHFLLVKSMTNIKEIQLILDIYSLPYERLYLTQCV